MNVDFSRSSPNTRILSDCITDFNLYTCIDLPTTNAPYILLITITLLRELIIFLFQNHSVELWITVTLLIIICFLIMFH